MDVLIKAITERRLWALIRAVETEIGGWGYARLDGDRLVWEEVFLVPQEVSGSEVDFESTGGDTAAIERAIRDRVLDDPTFVWVSWHSHHTMDPFWSKTDDARIAAMAKAGIGRLLSFVGCHDGGHRLRLDVFDVRAHGLELGQVTLGGLNLVSELDDEFTVSITKEIAANVQRSKTKSFVPARRTSGPPSPGPSDDELMLDVAEALAVRDLMDRGVSYEQAMRALDEIGLDAVDEFIDSGELCAPEELSIGGLD
jgi:hypothetical protein